MRPSSLLLWLVLAAVSNAAFAWSLSSLYSSESETDTEKAKGDFVSPIVNREIQVSVQAPWPSAPSNIYCEAWAFLRQWEFLDALAAAASPAEQDYVTATKHAVEIAGQILSETDQKLLQYALTMRAKSPTCELHRGLAEQHNVDGDFCVINGNVVVQDISELPKTIPALIETEKETLLLPGEVPRATTNPAPGLIVLYTNLGSSSFGTWYQKLVAMDLPFVVRHAGRGNHEMPSTMLQGYGVRLDIRNVEYKVFDDREDQTEEEAMLNASEVTSGVPQYLAGVNLTALLDGVGLDLQTDLWKMHEAQTQQKQLIPPAWQRRELSLQAATVIAQSTNNELLTLEQVSQNLPSLASTLVHVEVPEEISNVAGSMADSLKHMIQDSGGGFWINGKPLNVLRPSFNVFEMIDLLQDENEQLKQLQNTFAPHFQKEGALEQIQLAWSQGESFFEDASDPSDEKGTDHFRINVASGEKDTVIYLNNVERDAQYQNWPTSMQQMLMMMQYGMPPTVRRNLMTFLTVDNPLVDTGGTNWGKSLFLQLAQSKFPARLGTLIVDDDDIRSCEHWVKTTNPGPDEPCPMVNSWLDNGEIPQTMQDMTHKRVSARDIHRCYLYMAQKYEGRSDIFIKYDQMFGPTLRGNREGGYMSLFVLLNVHAGILESMGLVDQKDPILVVARELLRVKEGDTSYGKNVRFAVNKGLKSGMSFLNGRPLPLVSDEDGQDSVSATFMGEQEHIFNMVYSGEINDTEPRNVYRKLLVGKKKNVFPRVHPLLASSSDNFLDLRVDASPGSYLKSMSEASALDADAIISVDAFLDLRTTEGLSIAKEFLTVMEAFPDTIDGNSVSVAYRIIPSMSSFTNEKLCKLVASASRLGSSGMKEAFELLVNGKDVAVVVDGLSIDSEATCPDLTEDLPSANFILANGRVLNIEDTSLDTIDVELLISMGMAETKAVSRMLRPYVESDTPHGIVASTTAFLVASKSQGRSNPLDNILELEQQLDVSRNPLRFSFNDDGEKGTLKVSQVFCYGIVAAALVNSSLLCCASFRRALWQL
jgi:hypothetical protein